jgi:hypothetical protein
MTPKQKAKVWNKPPHRGWLKAHDVEAFEVFFTTRNYAEVARRFKISSAGVGKHAEKHNWIDRMAKRLTKLEEQVTDKLSDRLARDAHRQYNGFSLVEVNAINLLKRPDLNAGAHAKAHEIVMTAGAMETALKGKRLLAGEATEKVELTFKDVVLKLHEAANKRI